MQHAPQIPADLLFLSGDTYVYSGADQGTFEELLNADSVGSYLNGIIKPNYEYSRL